MLKASLAVALLAYAVFFDFTGDSQVEAAPAGEPLFGIASLGASATKIFRDVADYIIKLVTGNFDFSDSVAGMLKLLSDGLSKSFVSITNSNNENNNNLNTSKASASGTTTEAQDLDEQ